MERNKFMDYLNGIKKPWKFLAPMVDHSDEPYRILAMQLGANVCYSEMVNCKVFNVNSCNAKYNQWYTTYTDKRPFVIQICGNDPDTMLQTCLSVQDYCDAIDINFGCPQEIAKKGHYGSFLQDEWELISNIISKCAKNVKVPIFCKIRIFESIDKSVEYAKLFERSGASLLAVHGRTRMQKGENTGLASWLHIKAIKEALSIPVIANGNMIYKKNIDSCYECTKCDGVMIAEPHLYNPCIFNEYQLSSLAIFEMYLNIIKEIKILLKDETNKKSEGYHIPLCSIKSHAFKIFNTLFKTRPELRMLLNKCKCFNDYEDFGRNVKLLVDDKIINDSDLCLEPYIRISKVAQ